MLLQIKTIGMVVVLLQGWQKDSLYEGTLTTAIGSVEVIILPKTYAQVFIYVKLEIWPAFMYTCQKAQHACVSSKISLVLLLISSCRTIRLE